MNIKGLSAALLLACSPSVFAQESGFDKASARTQQQLEEAIAELNQQREQIAAEKIPLSRQLGDLEAQLTAVRLEYEQTTRLLDSRTLDLSNLRSEIRSREEEATYLSNLLNEYIRNFESRLHIAEISRYENVLETAKLASENSNLSDQEVYQRQAALLAAALDRLHDAVGGTRFEGQAVDDSLGLVKKGSFALIGPAAVFRSEDGEEIGTAEERLGSLEPAKISFSDPEDASAAEQVVLTGEGYFPLDPTLGNAHKIEATEETLWEHVQKGGPVMVPIFVLAGAALLVALYKWLGLMLVRRPSQRRIREMLQAVSRDDREAAAKKAKAVGGPTGSMLAAGVEHLGEPSELVEEVMYENVLTTRLKLQRMLPFIGTCAASAPLLGLLGTVTGIIGTFKMITVFGSGDVKTLSGGISEALITTEFGLIVAIPSLLLHAYLSRKARGVTDQMEKSAVALVNQASKTQHQRTERALLAGQRLRSGFPPQAGEVHAAPAPQALAARAQTEPPAESPAEPATGVATASVSLPGELHKESAGPNAQAGEAASQN